MALGDPMDIRLRAELKAAIAEAGGAYKLAEMLGVHPMAVREWIRVPAERLIQVERETGIRREQLRPDLFPEYRRRQATIDNLLKPKPRHD